MIAVVPGGAVCLLFQLYGKEKIIIIIITTITVWCSYVLAYLSPLHIVAYAQNSSFIACFDRWQGVGLKMNWSQLMKVVVDDEIPLVFFICSSSYYFFIFSSAAQCCEARVIGKILYANKSSFPEISTVDWNCSCFDFLGYQIIICLFFFLIFHCGTMQIVNSSRLFFFWWS